MSRFAFGAPPQLPADPDGRLARWLAEFSSRVEIVSADGLLKMVPAGGTTGQFLSKTSAKDFDIAWGSGAAGSVISVAATAPAAGFAIAGSPITTSGTFVFTLNHDLAALEGLGSTGLAARTAADTWAQRTLGAPAAGLTISNPAGVAGDPTFALANDLAALEALTGTGYANRTGTDTWALTALPTRAIGGLIGTPSAIDYTVLGSAPGPGTISRAWVKTASGTLTAAFKINGGSVTGISALATTSTGAHTSATAANALVAGDRVTVTPSSISGATYFEFALDITP